MQQVVRQLPDVVLEQLDALFGTHVGQLVGGEGGQLGAGLV